MIKVHSFELVEQRYLFTDLFIDEDYDLVFISMVYPDIEIDHEAVECVLPDGQVYRFTIAAMYWWHESTVACKAGNQELRSYLESTAGPVQIEIRYAGASRHYRLSKPAVESALEPPRTLSLFTHFKHDHYLLPVWLHHYRSLGVEHFYLYHNDSQENLDRISFDAPDVTFCAWDYPFRIGYDTLRDTSLQYNTGLAQLMAMNSCLYRFRNRTVWMAYFDLDEYLVTDDLRALLASYPRAQTSHVLFRNRWADSPGYDFRHADPLSFYDADVVCSRQCTAKGHTKMVVNTKNVALCKMHSVKDHAWLNGSREQISDRFFLHYYRYSGKDRESPIEDPVDIDPWAGQRAILT